MFDHAFSSDRASAVVFRPPGSGSPVSRATVDVHPPFVGEFLRLISFRAMEWDRRTISKL
jgi:hypothetical protein